jgi:hypothetical protein
MTRTMADAEAERYFYFDFSSLNELEWLERSLGVQQRQRWGGALVELALLGSTSCERAGTWTVGRFSRENLWFAYGRRCSS